jgi:hypothetical protein
MNRACSELIRRKQQEAGENRIMKSFMLSTYNILLGWSNEGRWDASGMWPVWGEQELMQGLDGETLW